LFISIIHREKMFPFSAVEVEADWLLIIPRPPFASNVTVRTVAFGVAVVAATSPRMTGVLASVALPLEPPHPARTMTAHTTATPAAATLLERDPSLVKRPIRAVIEDTFLYRTSWHRRAIFRKNMASASGALP
jgi:hypothetical protein